MLAVHLIQRAGKKQLAEYQIERKKSLIGRHSSCDVILADESVSRLHCVIMRHGDQVLITDLGSRTKTSVNETTLTLAETAALQHDDVIRLGDCELQVVIHDSATGDPSYCEPEYITGLPFPFVEIADRRSNQSADDDLTSSEVGLSHRHSDSDTEVSGLHDLNDTESADDQTHRSHQPPKKTATERYLEKIGSKSAAAEALDKMFPGSNGKR